MNIISQIDPSAFACAPRMHHGEPTATFPSSVSSRRRNLLALRAQNWRATDGKPDPWDYRIEYCESDGTQAVLLPVTPSPGIQILMDFIALRLDENAMFGCAAGGRYFQIRAANGAFAMYCTGSTSPSSGSRLVAGTRHSMVFGPTSYTIDGLDNRGAFGGDAVASQMMLFAIKQGASPYARSRMRVFSFSANYSGTDVIRLIPCVVGGVVGFWDEVSEQFMTDTYGGTLIAGPRI